MLLFKNEHVSADVQISPDGHKLKVQGTIANSTIYDRIQVIAPNPIDRMMNYSGSGLPWPNAEVAFDSTPNWKMISPSSGQFSAEFSYPNAYYADNSCDLIQPSLFFIMYSTAQPLFIRFELPRKGELATKSLTHRSSRTGPEFYNRESKIEIHGAEKTMQLYSDYKERYNMA